MVNTSGKVEVQYVPAPPSPPPPGGKYIVRAPLDKRENPEWPTLHLTESQALDLHAALTEALFGSDDEEEAPDASQDQAEGKGPQAD